MINHPAACYLRSGENASAVSPLPVVSWRMVRVQDDHSDEETYHENGGL